MQEVFEKILNDMKNKSYERRGNDGMGGELVVNLDDAIEIVKQEDKEYNNGWIPCSERLPEANQMVLATEKDSVILCCYEFIEGHGYCFYGSNGNVIAWHPLPQPYQPKGE